MYCGCQGSASPTHPHPRSLTTSGRNKAVTFAPWPLASPPTPLPRGRSCLKSGLQLGFPCCPGEDVGRTFRKGPECREASTGRRDNGNRGLDSHCTTVKERFLHSMVSGAPALSCSHPEEGKTKGCNGCSPTGPLVPRSVAQWFRTGPPPLWASVSPSGD